MIAMVISAGIGERLRPLTYYTPKPMVPVLNKPVLEYTLENLAKHHIREVVINLGPQSCAIQNYFGSGSSLNTKIHYSKERNLLGTAGGVKKVESIIQKDSDPDFLVASGDNFSDINFTEAIAFHKKKKALITIALKDVESRFEYGIPICDSSGRIQKFIEKPSWGDIFGKQVNTGIYLFNKKIFETIPEKHPYDFGKQLFPRLLKLKKPIFGYKMNAFWTDIGNIKEYRRAQSAALNNQLKIKISGKEIKPKIWVGERTTIEKGVKMIAPCFIGSDCLIKKNATIGAHAIVGNGAIVDSHANIVDSILWENVKIEKKVQLKNCIVGSQILVPESLNLYEAIIFPKRKEK